MTKRNIVHIEIPAQNSKAAGEFYEKLFGWGITHDEANDYTMFDAHEGPGGGFSKAEYGEHVQPGNVVVYISSDDIEADLKRAEELGASTIVPKSEIPYTGWFAMFKDPTGNTIGLYTAMQEQA